MSNSKKGLIPKQIVNAKGVSTTVWVKPDQTTDLRDSPLRTSGMPTQSIGRSSGFAPLPDKIEAELSRLEDAIPAGGMNREDWEDELLNIRASLNFGHEDDAIQAASTLGLDNLSELLSQQYPPSESKPQARRHPDEVMGYLDERGMERTYEEMCQYLDAGYTWSRSERSLDLRSPDGSRTAASMEFNKRGNPERLRVHVIPGGPEAQNNLYDTKFIDGVYGRAKPPTQGHRPVMGYEMLGTVWAANPQGEVKHFDHDWARAREWAALSADRDVRIAKAKTDDRLHRKGALVVYATGEE